MDSHTHQLISWLRCFDDDEQDKRMAAKCATELTRLSNEVDRLNSKVMSMNILACKREREIQKLTEDLLDALHAASSEADRVNELSLDLVERRRASLSDLHKNDND